VAFNVAFGSDMEMYVPHAFPRCVFVTSCAGTRASRTASYQYFEPCSAISTTRP
jgi:hypothetical protein